MIEKWKTQNGTAAIHCVGCTRETFASVWFMEVSWKGVSVEKRAPLAGGVRDCAVSYHGTWEAAQEFLMNRAAFKVQQARRELQLAQAFEGNVKGLKKPVAA